MKKTKKTRAALAAQIASIVGIIAITAIIGFGFTACGGDDNGGGGGTALTVTDLDAHNGKYFYGSNGSTLFLLSSSGNAAQISGGSVSLSVKTSAGNYTGSETVIFYVYILNTANVQTEMQGGAVPVGTVSVTFNNGNGGSVAFVPNN